MGLLLLACTALHGTVILAWTHIKWTSTKPLPDFLQFPAAELLLLNLLALPAAMYAMLLMVQAPVVAQRVLGVSVFLLVLAYLWFISALLLFIVRHKTALGICASGQGDTESPSGSGKLGWTGLLAVARFASLRQRSAKYSSLGHAASEPSSEHSTSLQDSAMALLPAKAAAGHVVEDSASRTVDPQGAPDLVIIADEPASSGDLGSMKSTSMASSISWRANSLFSRSTTRSDSKSTVLLHWQLANSHAAGKLRVC
jgi:MYXO-CTERM domain-containing protein